MGCADIERRSKPAYIRCMSNFTEEQKEAWHKDPANWRLGVFYYNPADPRLLPPKRIALMGWTINWANPRSIQLMLGIIVVILSIYRLVEYLGQE